MKLQGGVVRPTVEWRLRIAHTPASQGCRFNRAERQTETHRYTYIHPEMPNRRAVYLKCEAWRWAMPGVGLESATRTPRANGERTERAGKRKGETGEGGSRAGDTQTHGTHMAGDEKYHATLRKRKTQGQQDRRGRTASRQAAREHAKKGQAERRGERTQQKATGPQNPRTGAPQPNRAPEGFCSHSVGIRQKSRNLTNSQHLLRNLAKFRENFIKIGAKSDENCEK